MPMRINVETPQIPACPTQLKGSSFLQGHTLHYQPRAQHITVQGNSRNNAGPSGASKYIPKAFIAFGDSEGQGNILPVCDKFVNLT